MAKHFETTIEDDRFEFRRKEKAIAEEAALDGVYVVRTNLPAVALDDAGTVAAYKRLSGVERAFRSLKTVDLEVRPIFHWASPRVKAHVLLCMLAYYVEHHMRERLAPLLYDDTDREAAAKLRNSVVAKAQRSPAALPHVAVPPYIFTAQPVELQPRGSWWSDRSQRRLDHVFAYEWGA